jgi:hypothetical protein
LKKEVLVLKGFSHLSTVTFQTNFDLTCQKKNSGDKIAADNKVKKLLREFANKSGLICV